VKNDCVTEYEARALNGLEEPLEIKSTVWIIYECPDTSHALKKNVFMFPSI
jgi:hypothetical protein